MWNLARTLMSWSNFKVPSGRPFQFFVQASRGHRSFSWSLWTAESDRLGTWWFCDLELKSCHPEQLSNGWNGFPVSRLTHPSSRRPCPPLHCEDRTWHHPSWPNSYSPRDDLWESHLSRAGPAECLMPTDTSPVLRWYPKKMSTSQVPTWEIVRSGHRFGRDIDKK